jgi:hypothetical protein
MTMVQITVVGAVMPVTVRDVSQPVAAQKTRTGAAVRSSGVTRWERQFPEPTPRACQDGTASSLDPATS